MGPLSSDGEGPGRRAARIGPGQDPAVSTDGGRDPPAHGQGSVEDPELRPGQPGRRDLHFEGGNPPADDRPDRRNKERDEGDHGQRERVIVAGQGRQARQLTAGCCRLDVLLRQEGQPDQWEEPEPQATQLERI